MVWAWALETRTLFWSGHGCSDDPMLLERERYYGLSMDALMTVCSWNTNVIKVWAWMLNDRMLLDSGLGMDALMTVCSWNTNGIMVWAWRLS